MKRKTKKQGGYRGNKTKYNGIEFDSEPEVLMYKLLKVSGIEFKYIGKDKGEAIEIVDQSEYMGECYERPQRRSREMKDTPKIKPRTYTPDFKHPNEEWFIEVKGRKMPSFNFRWDLFKTRLNEWKFKPTIFMPVTEADMKQVIEILKQKGYGRK